MMMPIGHPSRRWMAPSPRRRLYPNPLLPARHLVFGTSPVLTAGVPGRGPCLSMGPMADGSTGLDKARTDEQYERCGALVSLGEKSARGRG